MINPTSNILVTGGCGFIGSNFIRRLLKGDWSGTIINLDLLTYAGNPDNLADFEGDPRYRFVQGSIGDQELAARLLSEHKIAAIVNFAAESHVDRSIDSPEAFLETNFMGTFRLLEAARQYWKSLDEEARKGFRFLHVSTDEVYGSLDAEDPAFSETTRYAPNSPYSASKAGSDHLVRAYHHTYGLPVLTTNCSNNYGPRQFPEKLIPLMILNALDGKPLPVYGDGKNIRDWLYVEDHCSAIALVLEQGRVGEVYNIGGKNEIQNIEIVKTLCAVLDRLVPDSPHKPHEQLITYVKDRPGHDRRYAIDSRKIEAELGWQPAETFATGLEKTVQWYLDNRDWCDKITSGRYQWVRLGVME